MINVRVGKAKNKIWFLLFLITWCAQMLTAVCFCCQKQGFHEDEYYTYYSTARTYGLAIEDGGWMEHDAYFNEFVVLEGQEFQYGLVKLVQSWDVHPPVYYWIFHTITSLFPGKFSKWPGLIINLAAFGGSMFLLRFLVMLVTKYNQELAWLVCFFYGFTPAVMSSVVFIRMYALLTVFVYLCAILHIKAIADYHMPNQKLSIKGFLLPLMVVTYLGFLTQYYYFIFLFFIAAAFCIYLLWKDRNLWNCIRYGCSAGAALILAYLTYPSCLGQMFRGQRGAQAASNFFDLSNTMMRLHFFWQLLDEYVFGKMLPVFLALILCLLVINARKGYRNARHQGIIEKSIERKKSYRNYMKVSLKNNREYWLLLFAVTGYFLVVSKTALLLGNTSIRYQTPIYGMVVLLIFGAIEGIGKACWKDALPLVAAAVVCLFINIAGLLSDRVVFLYQEDGERIAFAKEKAEQEVPAVYLYDAGQSWCVWDCADELFEYDRIYFASQNEREPIEDAVIAGSRELVVYLSNMAGTEGQLQRILDSNSNLTAYELQYQEKYCDVYYFYGER